MFVDAIQHYFSYYFHDGRNGANSSPIVKLKTHAFLPNLSDHHSLMNSQDSTCFALLEDGW